MQGRLSLQFTAGTPLFTVYCRDASPRINLQGRLSSNKLAGTPLVLDYCRDASRPRLLQGRLSYRKLQGRLSYRKLQGRLSPSLLQGRLSPSLLQGRLSYYTRVLHLGTVHHPYIHPGPYYPGTPCLTPCTLLVEYVLHADDVTAEMPVGL